MQARRSGLIVVGVLMASGLGAGILTWDVQRRLTALADASHDTDARIDRMVSTAGDMAAAQQAYVAPGQPDGPWFERFASSQQQLTSDVDAARQRARSSDASAALNAVSEGIGAVAQIDGRAQEHLAFAQNLIAADLIYSEGREAIDAMTQHLRGARDAEHAAFAAERASLTTQAWTVLIATALLWLGGLVQLVRVGASTGAASLTTAAAAIPAPPPAPVAAASESPYPGHAPIDLADAADLCTAISRMTKSVELPDLLARAAAVLDASGLIVWMGAGDELFAVTAHGYDPRVISRLGPIGRGADNATAACWRTGEIQTFSGDMLTHGAVVAPLFGPDACIGVLAAEVRHGREAEADGRAVTAMIAAQLATVVAAWPAASATTPDTSSTVATGS